MSEKKYIEFGKRIEKIIGGKDNSPKIAKQIPCAPETIYAWARGDQLPKGLYLLKLKELYPHISLDWLLTGKYPAKEPIDKAWTFSDKAQETYPDLRHVVKVANEAAEEQKASYLISALRVVADEIEGIKKPKRVVGR